MMSCPLDYFENWRRKWRVTCAYRVASMKSSVIAFLMLAALVPPSAMAQKRLVIIDQDGAGPADGNQMAMMVLLHSPQVEVLGITIVTGDAWRDEEVQHTLRMLELIGRTNVPVVPGAVSPLVRTQEDSRREMQMFGIAPWLGAWAPPDRGSETPPMPEGSPKMLAAAEDAAHFLVRLVRTHPGQITIFAAGPLTNIALAIAIDPKFAEQTRGIVVMGGSLNPKSDDLELITNPRHEFNFWFDPEAAHIVLRAHWPRIDVTTVDAAIQVMFTQEMFDALARSTSPAAQYIAKYSKRRYFMYDELAACAWLDPSIITRTHDLYMDVDLSHGPSYGHTLTWLEKYKPATDVQLVHAQVDVDVAKYTRMFLNLMSH
jgi:inosine-uridine nucleoside N-ribohydrolase